MSHTIALRDVVRISLLVLMSVSHAGCVSNAANVWTPSNWPGDHAITALTIDPATPTTLYAGTYDGLFKSTDCGGSWGSVNTGLTDTSIIALAIDPATPTILYVGTDFGGVFKSTDGGGKR